MTAMKAEMTLDGFTPMFDELTKKHGVMTSAVFGTIWRYCQMERKCCDAALDTVGKRMGVNKRTIMRHLEILVQGGYLIDATPNLKHRPHTYIDGERVGFKGSLKGVTKSHSTEAFDKEGVTKSHPRGDKKSQPGVTKSHLKKQREDTTEETKKEAASSPKPKLKPKPAKAQPKRPAAVHTYRAVFSLFPAKTTWPALDKAVGDDPAKLDKWSATCAAWNMQQNNPKNLTGILDWFRDGIPKYAKQNGGSNGKSNSGHNQADDSDLDRRIAAKLSGLSA